MSTEYRKRLSTNLETLGVRLVLFLIYKTKCWNMYLNDEQINRLSFFLKAESFNHFRLRFLRFITITRRISEKNLRSVSTFASFTFDLWI